jgi:hypothetical protein
MSASSKSILLASAAIAVTTAGCTLTDFNPPPAKTPVEQAASMAQTRCGTDVAEASLVPLVTGASVESVEPLYTRSGGDRSGADTHLSGALVRVRASQGVTAEWLDRALECHGAKRMLDQLPSDTIANDPFWLPGRTVDIDVESARDGFKVAVRADGTDEAQEILIRATAYLAASQRAASQPIANRTVP